MRHKKNIPHPYGAFYKIPWWSSPKPWWPTSFLAMLDEQFEALCIDEQIMGPRPYRPAPPVDIMARPLHEVEKLLDIYF